MQAARRLHGPPIPLTLEALSEVLESGQWGNRFHCNLITMPLSGQAGEPRRFSEMFHRALIRTANCLSVVFVCQTLANLASTSDELHLDGTFKVVPRVPHAAQLFTVHAVVRNKSFPILYALMNNRLMEGYVAILEFLKRICPLNPQNIITDFERGLQNAVLQCWPDSQVTGCWFHYCQYLEESLKQRYARVMRENYNYKKAVQMLMALPLLPALDIAAGFQEISEWCQNNEVDIQNLLRYVQRFWLGVVGVQLLTTFDVPRRTNNHVESFHYHLLKRIGRVHPNIWIFIEKLIAENELAYSKLQTIMAGGRISRPQSAKYLILSTRIRDILRGFQEGQVTRFRVLEICAYEPQGYVDQQQNWLVAQEEDHLMDEGESEDSEQEEDFVAGPVEGNIEVVVVPVPDLQIPEEQQQEAVPAVNNQGRCVICLNRGPTHLVAPCGHKIYCANCAVAPTVVAAERCPVCNGEHIMIVMVRD